MTDYHVRHHYWYEYSAPVRDVRQKLIMVPPDTFGDQTLTGFNLEVRGASGQLLVEWLTDRFGNRVCCVEAEHVESTLEFEARFRVRRTPQLPQASAEADTELYSRFTALTMPDARIRAAARLIAQEVASIPEQVARAQHWAASSIVYAVGVTGTQTPAAMALYLGQGVCQDYAHILLTLLRSLGIPARYISGHLLGEGAPHAWVEVLLPTEDDGVRIVAYDPTHRRHITSEYITVASGRDFADVTSTSGVFTGAAVGRLHWSKHASRISEAVDSAA